MKNCCFLITWKVHIRKDTYLDVKCNIKAMPVYGASFKQQYTRIDKPNVVFRIKEKYVFICKQPKIIFYN